MMMPPPDARPRQRVRRLFPRWLIGFMVLRLLLSAWFAAHTLPWERFDEVNHYHYARFIAAEGRLARPGDDPAVPAHLSIYTQFDQPPLYYVLLAPVIHLLDTPAAFEPVANPPPRPAGRFWSHYFVHELDTASLLPAATITPYAGGLWASRVVTAFIGVLALPLVWWAGRRLAPADLRLAQVATGLFAVWPAFVDLSIWLNNDIPLTVSGGLLLVGLVGWVNAPHRWQPLLWMGLATGLSLFTKLTGMAAVAIGGLVIVVQSARHLAWRQILRWPFVLAGGLLSAFVAYNLWTCQRVLCRVHRASLPFDSPDSFWQLLRPALFLDALRHLWQTGLLPDLRPGLVPPGVFVGVLTLVILVGVSGVVSTYITRPSQRSSLLWLLVFPVVAIGLVLVRVWWLQSDFASARYIALAFPALALLLAWGLIHLSDSWRFPLWQISIGAVLLVSVMLPRVYHSALLTAPPTYSHLPDRAQAVSSYRFDSGIYLAGYHLAGDAVYLYWATDRVQPDLRYVLIDLYTANGLSVRRGQLLRHPLQGGAVWQPGTLIRQSIPLMGVRSVTAADIRLYGVRQVPPLAAYVDLQQPDSLRRDNPRLFFDVSYSEQ